MPNFSKLYNRLYGDESLSDYYNNKNMIANIKNYRKNFVKLVQKYAKLNGPLTPKHEKYHLVLQATKNTNIYSIGDGEDFNDGDPFVSTSDPTPVKKGTKLGPITFYDDDDDESVLDFGNYQSIEDPDNFSYYYTFDSSAYPINDYKLVLTKSSYKDTFDD